MSSIEIRSYEAGDLEACRSLWVELTQWHRDIYDAPGIGGDDPGRKFDAHLALFGPELLWVAHDGGEVVGLVGLMTGHDDEVDVEVEPMIVTRSRRGEGIGRQLVEHVVSIARSEGHGTLSVRVVGRNRKAIDFYHDQGFTVLGMFELMQDFREGERPWKAGERLADRDFLV
jgi:GNAT superfamily N-acetyltransferase